MVEIVKNDNQVRVYLDEDRKSMDNMFDLSIRNGIWTLTVSRGGDTGMVFVQDTNVMRQFFEGGLEIIKVAEGS